MTVAAPDLTAGFDDPVHGAQRSFRAVLNALARPGSVQDFAGIEGTPAPLAPSLAAVVLTLLDHDTPVWLSASLRTPAIQTYLAFHTGAPVTESEQAAAFVLCAGVEEMPPLDALSPGTPDYPDSSATVVLALDGFDAGPAVRLTGPGIETEQSFQAAGLDEAFWQAARRNAALYPLGIDMLFCGPDAVAGLPRSTQIKV